MKKLKKFYLDFVSKPLQSSIPFVLFVLGIIAYVLSFFIPESSILQKIIFDVAELLIVSFFVSLVTNTYMFINIFRRNMEEIVSDYKYLENRKDIYSIWKRTSEVLFNSRFPEISDDLLKLVNESYFPQKESKYYSDYMYSVSIDWEDKEKNHIKVQHELTYVLHCNSKEKVELKSKSWTKIDPNRNESQIIAYSKYKVNNQDAIVVDKQEYVDSETEDLVYEETIELSGESTYNISKIITKVMDIDLDPYLGFKSQFALNKLRVQVFKPKDLCITFVPRSTSKEFDKIKKNEKYLEYQYNGLILPKQGFILIMQRK